MPVFVGPGSVVMFTIEMRVDQQACLMTFPYRIVSGDLTWPDQGEALAQEFDSLVVLPIMDVVSEQVSNPIITVQPVYPQRYRAYRYDSLNPGTINAAPLPSGTALVIRRQGIEAGRRNQGRIYIPGLTGDQVLNSRWTVGALQTISNILVPMQSELVSAGSPAVLWPIVWAWPSADVSRDVIITEADPIVRYQRRREVGVGI